MMSLFIDASVMSMIFLFINDTPIYQGCNGLEYAISLFYQCNSHGYKTMAPIIKCDRHDFDIFFL